MSTAGRIRHDLQLAAQRVAASRRIVDADQTVDLSGLEALVDSLCTAIKILPANERDGFQKPLVGLIDELDKLAGEVRAKHARLSSSLKNLTTGVQAAKAYGGGGPIGRK